MDHVEMDREIRKDAMERNGDVLKRRLQLRFPEQEQKQDNW